MAATTTNLTAACGLNDMVITVASATGFAVGNWITVDGEVMVQTAAASGLVIPVRRGGQNGTAQKAHPTLAPVTTELPSDVPLAAPGQVLNRPPHAKVIVSLATDQTVQYPAVDTIFLITKATAAAIFLIGNPTATAIPSLPDGVEVVFYSTTAAAHTITYSLGFAGNTTSSDVATAAATIGSTLTLLSAKGLIGIKASNGFTVA